METLGPRALGRATLARQLLLRRSERPPIEAEGRRLTRLLADGRTGEVRLPSP